MLWVLVGSVVAMGVALAGTRFLTTFVTPAEYGRLALMVSFAVLFDQVVGHAIGGAAMRFYSIYRSEGLLGDLRRVVFRSLLQGAAACLASAALLGVAGMYPSVVLLFASTGFSIALLVSGVGVRLAEGARRRRVSATFRGVFEILRFGSAALIIVLVEADAESAMTGFLVGAGTVALVHWFYLRYRLLVGDHNSASARRRAQLMASFRKYAMPLLLVGFGTWVYLMSPLWALGWFGDITEVGKYGAYHQLAFVPMMVVSGLLLTFLAPIVYENALKSIHTAMQGALRLAMVSFVMVTFIAAFAFFEQRFLATLLLGDSFRDGSWMFPWLILAGGCYGVGHQLLLKLRTEMKVLQLAAIQLGFAAAAVAAYSLAAWQFGVEGLIVAVVLVNATLLLVSLLISGTPRPLPEVDHPIDA